MKLRLGTRASALALAQSGQVAERLRSAHPGLEVELVPITTHGDREKGELAPLGGKGLFTQELETGLLEGSLDLAVHSLKDLPTKLPSGLGIAAFPERADPRDVLVSTVASTLEELPREAVVLTGATRRRACLLRLRPDLEVRGLRGNVDTRLAKWRESGADGLILAASGLARLGIEEQPAHPLEPETFVPAPGQGTLALETANDSEAAQLCRALDHPATAAAALAERRIVAGLGGDCTLPLGAWARPDEAGDGWLLTAFLATPDGAPAAQADVEAASPEEAADLALAALEREGSAEILWAVGHAHSSS